MVAGMLLCTSIALAQQFEVASIKSAGADQLNGSFGITTGHGRIQEQLGLRLRSQKAPVEMLVIDHAEKPSEN